MIIIQTAHISSKEFLHL